MTGISNYHFYLNNPKRQFPAWISPTGEWLVCEKLMGYDLHMYNAIKMTGREIETLPNGKVNSEMNKKNSKRRDEAYIELFEQGYLMIGFDHQNPSLEKIILRRSKKPMTKAQKEALKSHHLFIPTSEDWDNVSSNWRKRIGMVNVMYYYVPMPHIKKHYPAEHKYVN